MSIPSRISRRGALAAGAGLAATAIGLSGCGSNTGRPSGGQESGGGGGGALSQWYHEYGEEGVQQAVQGYAEDYPDAEVTVQWNPGDYETLVSSALLTEDRPDVFEYGNGPTLDMIKSGQVLDVTDLYADVRDDFPAGVLAPMTWEDKIWGVPQTVDMQMLFYRTSALQDAGVEPPETFEELVQAAQAVQSSEMGGFFASNAVGADILGNLLIWSSGQELINEQQDGPGFDVDVLTEALRQYADFVGSGAVLQTASQDWSAPDALLNGEAAMVWSGLWNVPLYQDGLGDDFGVVPFPPIGGAGRQAVPVGAFASVPTADGVDPEQAKAFIKWLWIDQTDKQLDFSTAYGYHIPARTSLVDRADNLASGVGADAARFVQDFGHAPTGLWTPAVAQALQGAVTKVAQQGADPAAQAKSVHQTASSEIERALS